MRVLLKTVVPWAARHKSLLLVVSRERGSPSFLFPNCLLWCSLKLLVWAVAPFQTHATLGAIMCRQVLSRALISVWVWKSCSVLCAFLLISCGNSQRGIISLVFCSRVGERGSKYLSKIRAIDCHGTELSQIYGLLGVSVCWAGNLDLEDAAVSCCFLPRSAGFHVDPEIFKRERLQVACKTCSSRTAAHPQFVLGLLCSQNSQSLWVQN